jgi:branched-chain amino acid aminotransferase
MSAGPGAAYVNGAFVSLQEASVPFLDWGFTKSDATYDVVAVTKGRFFRLDRHLDRFEASVSALSMSLPVTRGELAAILAECVRRAGLDDAYVSMTCTRGVSPVGIRDPRLFRNALYVYAVPYFRIFDAGAKGRFARLHISDIQRIPPQSVDPRVKNYHWLDLTRAQIEALEDGADLPLLVDGQGNITEGFGYNAFAVFDSTVVTPDRGVLEGITRATVLEICEIIGIPLEVRPVAATSLSQADEVFLTSTAGGIMPVGEIDGHILGNGDIGPITSRIERCYWDWHEDPAQIIAVRDL